MWIVRYYQRYDNEWHEVGRPNPYPTKEMAEEIKQKYELKSPSNKVHIEYVDKVNL